ncbi:MAG TPA: ribbon-helix-helix protein, CopG family [Vicinamibacteria bacterium]|nr:ribbon-helix-helix protein, CopG family [Vicinamibacteria bacterium]
MTRVDAAFGSSRDCGANDEDTGLFQHRLDRLERPQEATAKVHQESIGSVPWRGKPSLADEKVRPSLPSGGQNVCREIGAQRRKAPWYNWLYLIVKTAISIPDELFREVELCARRLKVSRSRLFADAVREYLARRKFPRDATEAWNEVIAEAGQPGDEPAAVALRNRTKAVLRDSPADRR